MKPPENSRQQQGCVPAELCSSPERRLSPLRPTPTSSQPSLGWENPTAFLAANFGPGNGEKDREGAKKNQPTHYADVHNWTFKCKLAPGKIRVRARNSIRARRGAAVACSAVRGNIALLQWQHGSGMQKALGEQGEPGRAGRKLWAPAGPAAALMDAPASGVATGRHVPANRKPCPSTPWRYTRRRLRL